MLPSALLVLGRFAFDLLFHFFFGFLLLFHERNLVDHGSNVECGVLGLCSTLIIVYILVLISAGLPLNSSDLPRFCGPFEIFRFQVLNVRGWSRAHFTLAPYMYRQSTLYT